MATDTARQVLLPRYATQRGRSVNRRILGATLTVGALTLAAKLAAMVKDVLAASSFGTGDALDAFCIAVLLPSYLVNIMTTSAGAAIIPVYIQVRDTEGPAAARRLAAGVMTWSLVLLLAITAGVGLLGPLVLPVLGSNFAPEKLALTTRLFYVLLPIILLNGVATIWGALLNADEHFGLVGFAFILAPLGIVAALLVLPASFGVHALALGTVVGFVLQTLLLAVGMMRCRACLLPGWYGLEPGMRRVLSQYLPMVAGGAIMSSTVLVDQGMAAVLDSGSVATLNYANKLVSVALTIGTMALGTALTPYFSRMVAASDWAGVRHALRTWAVLTLAASTLFTVLAFALSTPLIRFFFQRGQFTEADTLLVSRVQQLYLLQLPFFSLGILFVRLISSLQANHILLWGTLISFAVNLTLDYLFLRSFGVAGIALSTTFVYIFSCGYLAVMLQRTLRRVEGQVRPCA